MKALLHGYDIAMNKVWQAVLLLQRVVCSVIIANEGHIEYLVY